MGLRLKPFAAAALLVVDAAASGSASTTWSKGYAGEASSVVSNLSTATTSAPSALDTTTRTITAPYYKTTSTKKLTGCAAIGEIFDEFKANPNATGRPFFRPTLVTECLESVPLNVNQSSQYCDFIEPFYQFQSTLAYQKDPPLGWPMPGCDMLGGLAEIKGKVNSEFYKSQWAFEQDLYALGNVLPYDFHIVLQVPLMTVFHSANMNGILVSVSSDGLELPELYIKGDLDIISAADGKVDWTPSPLVTINGQNATLFVQNMTLNVANFQDNDAIYNTAFYSLPMFNYAAQTGSFHYGGYIFGLTSDSYTWTFANGSTTIDEFYVASTMDLSGITSGADLFAIADYPGEYRPALNKTAGTVASRDVRAALTGYPEPVVIHQSGYTSGYFLNSTKTAVLAMQAFVDAAKTPNNVAMLQQQAVIKKFLAECKTAGMDKLIVDVQGNGGGQVFNGYDAFKQLFPDIEPFGSTRMRATPLVNYMGTLFGDSAYNTTSESKFQYEGYDDVNDKPFTSWPATESIHGDNFTAQMRYKLSDIITSDTQGMNVTGYFSNSNPPAAVFNASSIVLLYDGLCGSTCATFAEMMKSQGGVRSIAVGGRPQTGPMQGVAGSKGGEVLTYSDITKMIVKLPAAAQTYKENHSIMPNYPPEEYTPDMKDSPPLGNGTTFWTVSSLNFRNNMHRGDDSYTPLQYTYEASNCRLFYTPTDIYNITGLWERVERVAWHGAKCVKGSSVNSDDTFPEGAYDTVAFSDAAYPNIVPNDRPGLLQVGDKATTWTSESGGRYEDDYKAFVEAINNGFE